MTLDLDQLVEKVNAWCRTHQIVPANGQVAASTSVRTLRYYRTMGLMDAPTEGGGQGYGERHFLQATSVRILQAQGLPLTRIQSLLFGRTDAELRQILDQTAASAPVSLDTPHRSGPPPADPAFAAAETWRMTPLTPDLLLINRGRAPLSEEVLTRLRAVLDDAGVTA